MERLTIRTPKGAALNMADHYANESAARKDLMRRWLDAVERLAAYEDTGLTPEAVATLQHCYAQRGKLLDAYPAGVSAEWLCELARADKEERLVVHKVQPGSIVWVVDGNCDVVGLMLVCAVAGFVICSPFANERSAAALENLQRTLEFNERESDRFATSELLVFQEEDCYLTRQEAEAALKGGEG